MDGEYVLAEAVEAYRGSLGDRLLAAYALGSLAHGGFSELVSDVDLGLIVSDPIESGDGETIFVPLAYRAFAIARYNPDGSLDTSFGASGAFITDVPDRSTAQAVAIEDDGKIVAIGSAESVPGGFAFDLALVRYERNGSLDAGFDSDGRVYTDFGVDGPADDFGNAVAIKNDGTILAAGSTRPRVSGSDSDFAVAAYEGR